MYDVEQYQIACELDVTLQVVQDYRTILDEQCRLDHSAKTGPRTCRSALDFAGR